MLESENSTAAGGDGPVPGGFGQEEREGGGEGHRNFGGNRWPREETLALLKIRSDMDVAFRDSALKAPLWTEVSRYVLQLFVKLSEREREMSCLL